MSEQHKYFPHSLIVEHNQALISVPVEENGREFARYFFDIKDADEELSRDVTTRALNIIGAWEDIDWQEMEEELYTLRHQSTPTPPIEL